MKYVIKIVSIVVAMLCIAASGNSVADETTSLLINAIGEGHYDEATQLIKSGADIDGKTEDGNTALSLFVIFHNEDAVKFCLASGADVNQKGRDGKTPLEWAEYVHGYGPPTNILSLLKKAKSDPQALAETLKNSEIPPAKKTKTDPLGLGKPTLDSIIGKKVPYSKWRKWGSPNTLPGTNNSRWVAYLPKANISFISDKKTDIIEYAVFGKGAEEKAGEVPDWIKNQFSVWNGSHKNLTKHIKENMEDPSSYKHVETTYSIDGRELLVFATFRGKNAFNAIVTNRIKARVNKNGKIVTTELIE